MKKKFIAVRDILIAGLFFLLPLLALIVVLNKIFHIFSGLTTKLAALLGVKDTIGIPAPALVGFVTFILLCLLCGYLIRVAYLKYFSQWLDSKLKDLIPKYKKYHSKIISKLDINDENVVHETAAWIDMGEGLRPGFIMDTMPDEKLVVFLPSAGNIEQGAVMIVEKSKAKACPECDWKSFRAAVANLGRGFSKLEMK